jgi:hypothetical protein
MFGYLSAFFTAIVILMVLVATKVIRSHFIALLGLLLVGLVVAFVLMGMLARAGKGKGRR